MQTQLNRSEQGTIHPFYSRIIQKRGHRPQRAGFLARESGCIEWQGALNSKGHPIDGHGLVSRSAWEAIRGPIPKGHQLRHECRNAICANVAHLKLLSAEEALMQPRTTVSYEKLTLIVQAVSEGVSHADIAVTLGVGKEYARDIWRGRIRRSEVAQLKAERLDHFFTIIEKASRRVSSLPRMRRGSKRDQAPGLRSAI